MHANILGFGQTLQIEPILTADLLIMPLSPNLIRTTRGRAYFRARIPSYYNIIIAGLAVYQEGGGKKVYKPKNWKPTSKEQSVERISNNSYIQAFINSNYEERGKLPKKLKKLAPVGEQVQAQLTSLFMHCNKIIELEYILDLNQVKMNSINATAAMAALARICKLRKVRAGSELSGNICDLTSRIMSVLDKELNQGELQLREMMNVISSISKIAESCTDLQFVHTIEHAFLGMMQSVIRIVQNLSVRDLSDVLVASSRTKWYDPELFDEFAYHLVKKRKPEDFLVQDISLSLWAIGKVKHGNKKVIQRLMDYAKHHFVNLNDQAIANIIWSLALLRYREYEFLNMVEYGIIRRIIFKQRERTHLNQLMFAFARFGVSDIRTMDVLASTITDSQFDFRDQHNALITIYTFSILQCDVETAQKLLNLVLTQVPLDRLRAEQIRQIRTSQQLFLADNQTLQLPQDLQQLCLQTQKQYIEHCKQQRHELVEKVCEIIRENRSHFTWVCDWEEKCIIGQGEMCVHLALHFKDGRRLVMQVMDSNCFIVNEDNRMMNQAIASTRLIKYYGWEPIVLSVFEWKQLEEKQDKISYLLKLLS